MRRRRTAGPVVLVLVVAVGCGGGSTDDDGIASDGSSPAVDAADPTTVLGVLDAGVDVADDAAAAPAPDYRPGEDGEGLAPGDLVRTDATGFAELRWFDGALARLDRDTTMAVTALALDATPARVETRLDVGRTWHRLEAGAADYEVETAVGTAAVRGTGFTVSCDDGCIFGVVEGALSVATIAGVTVDVGAGFQVTVDADGQPGELVPLDRDDPWIADNLERDGDEGFPEPPADDGPPEPGLDTARLDGTYAFSFTMTESNRPALVGQQYERTWRFFPDCADEPCGGEWDSGGGGREPFAHEEGTYTTSWVDRPAGSCPDGSPRWAEDFSLVVTPTAFEQIDGRTVATAVEAVWRSTLDPLPEAVASGCDPGDGPTTQVLEGTAVRGA